MTVNVIEDCRGKDTISTALIQTSYTNNKSHNESHPGVLKPIGGVVVVASLPATTVGLGVVMTTTGRSSPSSTAGGRMTPTSTTGFNVGEVDTGDEVVIIEGVGSSGVYGGLTGVGGLGRGLALSSLDCDQQSTNKELAKRLPHPMDI
jgi:hypothetical protein